MTDPKLLPVWQSKDLITDKLKESNVIIVESPTGSGKTTQIPLILKEALYTANGIIGITQPRRIATLSVCSYINRQLEKENLSPSYCAYKMRFYDTTDKDTKIKILTDGMLLQELKTDPNLSSYSVIMVDEAHERSLNIDFILGMLKQILKTRTDLKVIISSATLNTKVFSKFFGNAPIITINARTFDVKTIYYPLSKKSDIEELSFSICQIINSLLKDFKKSSFKESNDTLVFLSGESDIKKVMQDIYANCDAKHLQIYPLYGRLNKEEQEMVFKATEEEKIKVVLSTNIAETSLTIDGIKTVIDSGLAKINYYNQTDFTSSLVTRPISRSSAMQRTGRAGRTCNGTCYRLYSKEDFLGRILYTQEEILRTDLSEVVLRMVDLGIINFEDFPFIRKPENEALKSGEYTLRLLGAIDNQRKLTLTGSAMVKFPLLPRHSRCIVQAMKTDTDMIKPVCVCVSFLSCKTPFVLPPGEEDLARSAHRSFSSEFGDFISYQFIYLKYTTLDTQEKKQNFCTTNYLDFQSMEEIVHVTNQLCEIVEENGIIVSPFKPQNTEDYAKRCLVCLASGLMQYVCVKKKGSVYRTLNADEIYIHPGSAWFRNPPTYILAGEIVMTTKLYARTVSPLKIQYLDEVLPNIAKKIGRLPSKVTVEKESKLYSNKDANKNTTTLYGYSLPLIKTGGKKDKNLVVIPYEKLSAISRTYRKASRHPKNVYATLEYNGYYIHYGDKLYDILRLSGRLKIDNLSFVKNINGECFSEDNLTNIIPYLPSLLKLSPMTKYKDRLGFVELVCTKDSFFMHVNSSFTEAINNTAYSLLTLIDKNNSQAFKDTYNRIVKMLD